MMQKIIIVVITVFLMVACSSGIKQFEVKVNNTTDQERIDEMFSLTLSKLMSKDPQFNVNNFSLYDGDKELPYQIEESGDSKEVILTADFKPGESKKITVKYGEGKVEKNFKARTYSELAMKEGNVYYDKKFHGDHFVNVNDIKVPDIHTDHDALFKYEGPGWESDIIGYRFYLDWRNATDIFGKKITGLVLQNVGVTDTVAKDDSYHEMQEWGMDIFKVGSSLGIGSPGMMYDEKVFRVEERDSVFCKIANGPVKSSVETKYMGWKVGDQKYDFVSNLSIGAGSRLTRNKVHVSNNAENIATGIAKYKDCSFIVGKNKSGWNYIGLYGKQTLADDNLGIAILYPVESLKELTEDEINHIVVLNPVEGNAVYYFGAAWEQEPNGIASESDFIKYLDETVIKLNNPVVVE